MPSPNDILDKGASPDAPCVVRTTRAMASNVSVQVPAPAATRRTEKAIERAFGQIAAVERACSRFDPSSALSRINRRPNAWHRVPQSLFAAARAAASAHLATNGRFDPRVLDRLIELGYDRSFSLIAEGGAAANEHGRAAERPDHEPGARPTGPWAPGFVPVLRLVKLGGCGIDLGGIGKGLALDRAARQLRRTESDFLVDAGGDIYAAGRPAPGSGWMVGVESPAGGAGPVAVLELSDLAVATSSIRIRQWSHEGRIVHHLIDPRTGEPGGDGLASVTVLHPEAATAEVWSKALFLSGRRGIAADAVRSGLAVLWVEQDGALRMSRPMGRHVAWTA